MTRRSALSFPLLACLALAGCTDAMHPYSVSSTSMYPTIRPGDRLFIDQTQATRNSLRDGDIIALRRDNDVIVIKRILAMPGETISGQDRKIFRNGKQVDEPYLALPDHEQEVTPTFPARTMPPGELFVLGDNRDHSLDSRADEYAPVKLTDVAGKYSLTYWHAAPAK